MFGHISLTLKKKLSKNKIEMLDKTGSSQTRKKTVDVELRYYEFLYWGEAGNKEHNLGQTKKEALYKHIFSKTTRLHRDVYEEAMHKN